MLTIEQAIDALRKLQYARHQITLSVFTRRLMWARDRAVNYYMLPGGSVGAFGRRSAPSPADPNKLTHRSGAMGRGTKVNPPRQTGDTTTGGLMSIVPYSAIHEYGGVTSAHTIRPLRGSVLAWQGPSGPRFARVVNHPGSRIPPRPRLRPALEDMLPLLHEDLRTEYSRAQAALGLG